MGLCFCLLALGTRAVSCMSAACAQAGPREAPHWNPSWQKGPAMLSGLPWQLLKALLSAFLGTFTSEARGWGLVNVSVSLLAALFARPGPWRKTLLLLRWESAGRVLPAVWLLSPPVAGGGDCQLQGRAGTLLCVRAGAGRR